VLYLREKVFKTMELPLIQQAALKNYEYTAQKLNRKTLEANAVTLATLVLKQNQLIQELSKLMRELTDISKEP
jgi:hypothetical protein